MIQMEYILYLYFPWQSIDIEIRINTYNLFYSGLFSSYYKSCICKIHRPITIFFC